MMYDVIIIGGGVSGAAAARELSRYQAKILLLEKEEDVCCGTSKANSAIVHAGYDAAEGSLMAKLNVRGNERMDQLSKELDFPFKRNVSIFDYKSDGSDVYSKGSDRNVCKDDRMPVFAGCILSDHAPSGVCAWINSREESAVCRVWGLMSFLKGQIS